MFRIPLLTHTVHRLKEIINRLEGKNLTELPSILKSGLSKYLIPGEEIILTLRNYRAIYKAPRWLDSNTFFNSWFILTNQRIIILRNSSSFKRFRDIPLDDIQNTHFEMERSEPRLTILSQGKEDIIDFSYVALKHCKGLEEKIKATLEEFRKRGKDSYTQDMIYCHNCGNNIPKQSKFCSNCGRKLN